MKHLVKIKKTETYFVLLDDDNVEEFAVINSLQMKQGVDLEFLVNGLEAFDRNVSFDGKVVASGVMKPKKNNPNV